MSDPFSDDMAAAHRKDYAAHRLFDDAQRALRDVLSSAGIRLSASERDLLSDAQRTLEKRAAHIVAVWD